MSALVFILSAPIWVAVGYLLGGWVMRECDMATFGMKNGQGKGRGRAGGGGRNRNTGGCAVGGPGGSKGGGNGGGKNRKG